MPTPPTADVLERFTALYRALSANGDWRDQPAWLRFAAHAAILSPLEPSQTAARIRTAADRLRRDARWFSDLSSPLRFVIAALLVQDGVDPAQFGEELARDHERFRVAGVRHGGCFETLAIAIMRHLARGPIPAERIVALKAMYDELKRHHWWLTGPDDLPACACLAGLGYPAAATAAAIDSHYRQLQAAGLIRGNHLLACAQLLALGDRQPEAAVARVTGLVREFARQGDSVWHEDYDAVALLSLLDQEPALIVARFEELHGGIARLVPQLFGQADFNLATDLTVLDLVHRGVDGLPLRSGRDLERMLDRLHVLSAAMLLLSLSSDAVVMPALSDWPATAISPLAGMP